MLRRDVQYGPDPRLTQPCVVNVGKRKKIIAVIVLWVVTRHVNCREGRSPSFANDKLAKTFAPADECRQEVPDLTEPALGGGDFPSL